MDNYIQKWYSQPKIKILGCDTGSGARGGVRARAWVAVVGGCPGVTRPPLSCASRCRDAPLPISTPRCRSRAHPAQTALRSVMLLLRAIPIPDAISTFHYPATSSLPLTIPPRRTSTSREVPINKLYNTNIFLIIVCYVSPLSTGKVVTNM
jgi:hypothetical protein